MSSDPPFDGATYDPDADGARLQKQLERVREIMLEGRSANVWRMATEVAALVGPKAREPAIQARIRDLRKVKFGGYRVAIRRRGEPRAGLWEYKLLGATEVAPEGARVLDAVGPTVPRPAAAVLLTATTELRLRQKQGAGFSAATLDVVTWLESLHGMAPVDPEPVSPPAEGDAFDFEAHLPAKPEPPSACDHGLSFDLEEAKRILGEWEPKSDVGFIMGNPKHAEVRKRFPRLHGPCPKGCGFEGIAYASPEHFSYGDW